MTIDRETVLWLVSTAPQVLAALTALSMAALTFKVSSYDDMISRDDTQTDILGDVKQSLYHRFQWVVIPSICVIAIDLLYICFADWVLECENRSTWLLVIFFILNLICLGLLCDFPLRLVNPNYAKKLLDKRLKEYNKGTTSVDAGTFILHFRDLEKNLKQLYPNWDGQKPLTTYEMIKGLGVDKLITKDQYNDLMSLNRLRNYIVHDADYKTVDKDMDDMLLKYIQITENLQIR